MLKSLPKCLGPELAGLLAELEPGMEIVLADAFFPGGEGINDKIIDGTGRGLVQLATAIAEVLPLSAQTGASPLFMMAPVELDSGPDSNWDQKVMEGFKTVTGVSLDPELVERSQFYKRTMDATAVISTTDEVVYGNLGIIVPEGLRVGIPQGIDPGLLEILYRMGHGEAVVIAGQDFIGDHNTFKWEISIKEVLGHLITLWEMDTYADDAVAIFGSQGSDAVGDVLASHDSWKNAKITLPSDSTIDETMDDWRSNAIIRTSDKSDTGVLVRKGLTRGI